MRGPMAILELLRGRFGYVSVTFGQSVFSTLIEIGTRFYRKGLCKVTFVKHFHADFYGDLDVNFVVTVFDPTVSPPAR